MEKAHVSPIFLRDKLTWAGVAMFHFYVGCAGYRPDLLKHGRGVQLSPAPHLFFAIDCTYEGSLP